MDNRKIILGSYLATAIVTWFLVRSGIQYFYLAFYQVRRLPGIGVLREAVPVLLGATAFIVLLKHVKANAFMDDVVAELKKVTWPGREDVSKSTTVVIICILIASFILAGFDVLWGKVITFLLHS